jgi:hypothetical protein
MTVVVDEVAVTPAPQEPTPPPPPAPEPERLLARAAREARIREARAARLGAW